MSDVWNGLPMRLSLRVVDESCAPFENAIVGFWHTNYAGIYSGRISTTCNRDEADRAAQCFRGYARTDANGRVDFDSCFPGWYAGRVVHVHFRVMRGAYDGSDTAGASLVSQLFWSGELVESIFASEPLYSDFGQPDTSLGDDDVVGGEDDPSTHVLDVARGADGAMIASKTVVLRSASSSGCTRSGAGGGGRP